MDRSDELCTVAPAWVPDGYRKIEERNTETQKTLIYQNESGQLLKWNCSCDPSGSNFFVDAENGEILSSAVAGHAADLILFDDPHKANALLWTDQQERAFYISAFLEESDLLKMANSIDEP